MLAVIADVRSHAIVRGTHPATSAVKDDKDDNSDSGSDAEHFYPARHFMDRCAPRIRSYCTVGIGMWAHVHLVLEKPDMMYDKER